MERNATISKTLLNFIVFGLLSSAALISCSKPNITTVAETPSTSGLPTGIFSIGPSGPHNNLVYYGSTDPDPAFGCLGDYYLDVSQGLLYGPKISDGWGAVLVMKGASAAENKIYSGTEIPADAFGNYGDYYLDITNFVLYGPRSNSGWGNPINLLHPKK
jgi:hypothetical protein